MPISEHKNFAISTLATPPSSTDGTSLVVASGHGALFPEAPFNVTVWPTSVQPTSSNAEIMRVTNKATDTFTVTRAQEGTSARTHLANAQIAATITARTLTDVEYGAHGIINVKDPVYGATGNGVADDTAAVIAASAAADDKKLLFPAGEYVITASRIDVTTTQHWVGDGSGVTTIRFTAAPASGDSTSLNVYGPSLSQVAVAPDSVAIGAETVTFPSDPGALSGLLVIRDSANSSFNASRTDYKAGEIVEIASQATTTLTLRDRTMGAYTASGTFLAFTYVPIEFSATGIRFEFPSDVNLGLRMRRVRDYRLVDCEFAGASLATVQLGEYCYRGDVRGCYVSMTTTAASEQYGWSLTGVQELSIAGGGAQATRHALMTGGDAIPNRRILVQGGNYTLTSEAGGLFALDCHGNAEFVRFDNNVCDGALLAGDYIAFCNNTVTGRGYGVGIREMLGSSFTVSNNTIQTYAANASALRSNGITFQASGSGSFTTRGGHLRICDNDIVYTGATARSGMYFGYDTGFAVGSTTDVTICGNRIALTTGVAAGVAVYGLTGSGLRSVRVSGNTMINGGFDLRYIDVLYVDDNDVRGATAQGVLVRNDSGTSSATQSVYIRRNYIAGSANAGIYVLGDATNELALVRIEDNDLPNNSTANQGTAALEAAIYASQVLLLIVRRNTALTAGANQTYDYSFTSEVDAVRLFDNEWIVGTVLNSAAAIAQDYAQTYTPTNVTPDRSYDADTVAVAELADVVGTLITDLQTARVIK